MIRESPVTPMAKPSPSPFPQCPWCLRKITTMKAVLVIHDGCGIEAQLERWGKYAWADATYHFSHSGCNPPGEDEVGYYIELDRINTIEDYEDWQRHMRQKNWTSSWTMEALAAAFDLTGDLRKRLEHQAKRKAISPKLRSLVLERDGFRCRRCGAGPKTAQLEVDHVHPVARRGTTTMENLQTLCGTCNIGKSARLPHAHDLGDEEAAS